MPIPNDFDPIIPFEADGVGKARFVGEAPDFEILWDFVDAEDEKLVVKLPATTNNDVVDG